MTEPVQRVVSCLMKLGPKLQQLRQEDCMNKACAHEVCSQAPRSPQENGSLIFHAGAASYFIENRNTDDCNVQLSGVSITNRRNPLWDFGVLSPGEMNSLDWQPQGLHQLSSGGWLALAMKFAQNLKSGKV